MDRLFSEFDYLEHFGFSEDYSLNRFFEYARVFELRKLKVGPAKREKDPTLRLRNSKTLVHREKQSDHLFKG